MIKQFSELRDVVRETEPIFVMKNMDDGRCGMLDFQD